MSHMNNSALKDLRKLAKALLVANGNCCYICGNQIDGEFNKDHVFPESLGYSFISNMMPTHQTCNLDKGDRIPTLAEIECACIAYEKIGKVFDPRMCMRKLKINKYDFQPMEFYIRNLKKAA